MIRTGDIAGRDQEYIVHHTVDFLFSNPIQDIFPLWACAKNAHLAPPKAWTKPCILRTFVATYLNVNYDSQPESWLYTLMEAVN